MIVLHRIDARVLFHLRDNGPMTPSRIGLDLDFKYEDASAHITKPLRRLVALNLVRKEAKNKRVVKYRCIKILPPMVLAKGSSEKVVIRMEDIKDDPMLSGNILLPDSFDVAC